MEDKVKITPIDMKNQKLGKVRENFLLFTDNYLQITYDFDHDSMINPEDEAMGWKEDKTCFTARIKKAAICGIELCLQHIDEIYQWKINISPTGASDYCIFFKVDNRKGAEEMFHKLNTWWES